MKINNIAITKLHFNKKPLAAFKKLINGSSSKDFIIQPNTNVKIQLHQINANEFKVLFILADEFVFQLSKIEALTKTSEEWEYQIPWDTLCAEAQNLWNKLAEALMPYITEGGNE